MRDPRPQRTGGRRPCRFSLSRSDGRRSHAARWSLHTSRVVSEAKARREPQSWMDCFWKTPKWVLLAEVSPFPDLLKRWELRADTFEVCWFFIVENGIATASAFFHKVISLATLKSLQNTFRGGAVTPTFYHLRPLSPKSEDYLLMFKNMNRKILWQIFFNSLKLRYLLRPPTLLLHRGKMELLRRLRILKAVMKGVWGFVAVKCLIQRRYKAQSAMLHLLNRRGNWELDVFVRFWAIEVPTSGFFWPPGNTQPV